MNRRNLLAGLAGILATGFAPAAVGSGILMPTRKIVTKSVEVRYHDLTALRRPPGVPVDGRGWEFDIRNADGSLSHFQAEDLWFIRPEETRMDFDTFRYKFYQ